MAAEPTVQTDTATGLPTLHFNGSNYIFNGYTANDGTFNNGSQGTVVSVIDNASGGTGFFTLGTLLGGETGPAGVAPVNGIAIQTYSGSPNPGFIVGSGNYGENAMTGNVSEILVYKPGSHHSRAAAIDLLSGQ